MSSTRSQYCPGSYVYPKMGTLENPRKFCNQDFVRLRDHYLNKGELFTDDCFTANKRSLGWRQKTEFHYDAVSWKRPNEECEDPHFIVDGATSFDIFQNNLGDCWLLCTIASIATKSKVLEDIIPRDQGFSKDYAGIFHFRLWHLGEWYDVVVDDRLPFLNNKFMSAQPPNGNEFWPCLLEKAYAKLLGSYESLEGGLTADALMNLTGGLPMMFELEDAKTDTTDTYWNMVKSTSEDTVMTCSSTTQGNEDKLIQGSHAYSITDHAEVPFRDGSVRLLQVRNPWGHTEWNGDWSDSSPLWKELSEENRKRLQGTDPDDGLFWICWEDFVKEFSRFTLCSQVPDFLDCGNQRKKWHRIMIPGRWTKDCISWNNTLDELVLKNPPHIITVTGSDEDDSGDNVVISLMQNSRNRHKYGDWLPIGFLLYKLQDYLDKSELDMAEGVAPSNQLVVSEKYSLSPGTYAIIPYTVQGQYESQFFLQVFLKSFPEDRAHGCC